MCCSVFTAKFVYGCCLVKAQGFRPGGVHSHFLPHNLYSSAVHIVGNQGKWVPLGNSLEVIKQHKTCFLGPFRIPTQTFTFLISPITISFSSKTKHQARLSVTGQHFAGIKQWPKGLLGRGCLHQLSTWILAYVFMCHTPVTLIKSTYLLTYLLIQRCGYQN